MIVDLPNITSSELNERLLRIREEGGAVALGRVLTLVVVAGGHGANAERAIEATNYASREHPCRVIVVDLATDDGAPRLDGQIRVGADAGASEVILLRPHGEVREHLDTLVAPLLLPDAPIVVWWSDHAPDDPAADPLGRMASRRITDARRCDDPHGKLNALAAHYSPGDTDLSWARLTTWRAMLAAALDIPPHESVLRAEVSGDPRRPSQILLAAWLAQRLKCPVEIRDDASAWAITGVRLTRRTGEITVERPDRSSIAYVSVPGQPRQRLVLPVRTAAEALAEDLRRLDPDEIYARVLTRGLTRVEVR